MDKDHLMSAEFEFGKMKQVLQIAGGDDCMAT